MKRFLTVLIAAALVVSPVEAQAQYERQDRQRYEQREGRRNNDGKLILGIILGGMAGAVIASSNDRDYHYDS